MSDLLLIITDIIVISFDLLFYTIMFPRRTYSKASSACIYLGCVIIIFAYFIATYVLHFPAALSSALCMTIPCFLLFLCFAKYRDSRFLLTFCLIDTISLIVAFLGRCIGILFKGGEVIAIFTMFLLFIILSYLVLPYASKYKQVLDDASTGWLWMAVASTLIYFAMIFFAAYPKPLTQRFEYVPVWGVFAVVVLSCYAVFIHSILKTKKIAEQNCRLKYEKELYHMAFIDKLTGLFNRASYLEKINDLQRRAEEFSNVGFIVIDINDFKRINDTQGHRKGDLVLESIANALRITFHEYKEYLFRMGGDEFLVLLPNTQTDELCAYISTFREQLKSKTARVGAEATAAVGYDIISIQESQSLENAYENADRKMYLDKKKTKNLADNKSLKKD